MSGGGIATGLVLIALGTFLVLRTVVPGQRRSLPDLILGHPKAA